MRNDSKSVCVRRLFAIFVVLYFASFHSQSGTLASVSVCSYYKCAEREESAAPAAEVAAAAATGETKKKIKLVRAFRAIPCEPKRSATETSILFVFFFKFILLCILHCPSSSNLLHFAFRFVPQIKKKKKRKTQQNWAMYKIPAF